MPEAVRVAFRTLGCKVNRVESEKIAAELMGRGAVVAVEDEADVIVVNTCTVTGEADAKARKAVRRALAAKRGPLVLVTGCLAALDADGIRSLGPRVIVEADKNAVSAKVTGRTGLPAEGGHSVRAGEHFRTRALVKIEDGCDAFCSYCIVPHARGGPVSVPLRSLQAEFDELVGSGVAEVVLTGVNLGRYRDADAGLDEVVRSAAAAGFSRIRLSSIEPLDLTRGLLDTLASTAGVCPHLHVPMQSGSDRVLSAMGRHYSIGEYERRISDARSALPGLVVTTDVIAGFPGESDEEAELTLSACERIGFAKLHVFKYSRRAGTPAAAMEGQVPPAVCRGRSESLRTLGDRLRLEHLRARMGDIVEVLAEKVGAGRATGTTPGYESVTFAAPSGLEQGAVVAVEVTGTAGQGLLGRTV